MSFRDLNEESTTTNPTLAFPHGGGEMGDRIRAFDWARTAIGPPEEWSIALRTTLRIMLANSFPQILWWGPRYIQFYNDPYRPIPGAKHPDKALGRPGAECWSEIWHVIGPLIDRPFRGGPPTWDEDIYLEVDRHGFLEETHFTIAYSPVPDETVAGGIGGVLATVHEITGKTVGDRRVLALRDLGARSAEARSAEEACAICAQTLEAHTKDIPFALLYLIDPDRKQARLAGAAGTHADSVIAPAVVPLTESSNGWPFAEALRDEAIQALTDLATQFENHVPAGPWSDPPHTAVVAPIRSNRAHHPAGILVAGISARLQWDDLYRDFINLVSTQIATAIANAREYEEERRRAEALAEIDRAKTAFFSNVSHEFRTPLTLMLGPIEDLLSRKHTELPPAATGQLELAYRNALRLLKLVNTLLDFSRLEAGRIEACFEPTDLATFTADLASVFRAATERAGLALTVDCPRLPAPVYVDRDMWEKIVLNLVSNAFKFTLQGEIEVSLRVEPPSSDLPAGAAVLRVRDTGVGIPAEEMPRLFERFHRIQTTRGRTYEGSGIGLAFVQELVRLHGGSARAESQPGEGTTFIIAVPLGKDHLPADRLGASRTLASAAIGASPFVEEALRWLPEPTAAPEELPKYETLPVPHVPNEADSGRPRVLVADDNADIRYYLLRLLGERYNVEAVPDGRAALAAARETRPDLVLTDIMMPVLDGIGLMRELRADPDLRTIPIIVLSARADEEARVEGMQENADDYVVKPFSARELLARVASHLELARLREESEETLRESERQYRLLFESMIEGYCVIEMIFDDHGKPVDFRYLQTNAAFDKHATRPMLGKRIKEIVPDFEQFWLDRYGEVALTGKSARLENVVAGLGDQWFRASAFRVGGEESRQVAVLFENITERKRAEQRLRQAQKLESLGLLAGGVAHDFNNLLVGVIGNASLALDMLPRDHPATPLLDSVVDTGQKAAHLTRQMLAYSGKGKFFVECLNISALVKDNIELARPFIPKKVILRLELENDLAPIEADGGQIQQILMNLVINAAEAIGSQEGVITVKTAMLNVDEIYRRQHPDNPDLISGRYIALEVCDTGSGMDQVTRVKIFDPFFSTKFTGRGLGLAAVAGIVRGHHGAIVVTSAPGEGSTFTVLFPPAERAETPPRGGANTGMQGGAGVVLVIDDEQVVRDMAQRTLERIGCSALVAESGPAAIDILKRHPGTIDLAVLDLSMPGMSGEEALPELRKLRPGMKVFVSSGYSESEVMMIFDGQRVSGFLQKPYTASALAAKVAEALK